jgi:hypothetical protein
LQLGHRPFDNSAARTPGDEQEEDDKEEEEDGESHVRLEVKRARGGLKN